MNAAVSSTSKEATTAAAMPDSRHFVTSFSSSANWVTTGSTNWAHLGPAGSWAQSRNLDALSSLEKSFAKDANHYWSQRLDRQVQMVGKLDKHLSQATFQVDKQRDRFRTRNELWQARAETAAQWRKLQAERKFQRCASAVELYERRMGIAKNS
eukprot:TRINITY_DN110250_c0_g1_i1.p2 TRINITY_DN110250_c0_g1~~TRINITY_DN110250_c0_g1_i1.p2  ORF type:complete len:154 (-),score=33.43 TRINITY_DN110250_c0_g1_i1:5-466(-)